MKQPTKTILNFNLHQPLRLSPDKDNFLWDEKNKSVFREATSDYYLPMLEMLAEQILKNSEFRFNLGVSGTFLEQAKEYSPELVSFMKELICTNVPKNQIELLGETYYQSLSEFFKNPAELNEQVAKQKDFLRQEFGISPISYKHTKMPFSSFLGEQIKQHGFKTILTDIPDENFKETAYRLEGTEDVVVLKRNVPLSHKLSRGRLNPKLFIARPFLTESESRAKNYIQEIYRSTQPVLLSFAFGRVGNESYRQFWKDFVKHSEGKLETVLAGQLYSREEISRLPEIYLPVEHSISHLNDWREASKITGGLIDNKTEFELFKHIEQLFYYPSASLTEEDMRHRSILTIICKLQVS
jgi:hypothetical protein